MSVSHNYCMFHLDRPVRVACSLEFVRLQLLLSISMTSGGRAITRIGDTLATGTGFSRYTPEL